MDVPLPDGHVIAGVPPGTSKMELLHKLIANNHPSAAALSQAMAQQQVATDPVTQGAQNMAQNMPWWQQFAAGYGKAAPDIYSGIKQAFAGPQAARSVQSQIDEQKRIDEPLMKTPAGMAGNILGNAALFAPTAFLPGANTLTGAGMIGAGLGAAQPVGTGESRGVNAAMGAGGGVAGQAAGGVLGRLIRPLQSALSPEEANLAQTATKEGIPLTAGQATGSRPMQLAESVMENLPLTSKPQLAVKEAQQRAFTAAALRRAGMQGDVASPEALLLQKGNLGGALGNIAKQNQIDFNQGLTNKLADIVDNASQHLPPDQANKISGTVDKILSQVDQNGILSGDNYQGWREPLRNLASNSEYGSYFSKIRKALDTEFYAQLQGTSAQQYGQTSRQYANLKTIIDAMGGPGNLAATGQIPPAQLRAALARSLGRENVALGQGDMNELAKAGQLFVRDNIPNSGTAQRQFIQNLLTGQLTGAIPGAGIGYYETRTPEGAALGAAAGAGVGLLTPRAIQAAVNSPVGKAYLTKGMLPITEAQRAAIANAVRTGTLGAVPALSGGQ